MTECISEHNDIINAMITVCVMFAVEESALRLFHHCVVFASTAVQSTHTCPTTQNEENNHPAYQKTKETAGKSLGKIRSNS